MSDIPAGECLLCGGTLTGVHCLGHWSEYGGGGGFWFSALCQTCDIDFRLSIRNGIFATWRPDAPEASELTSIVGEDGLAALTAKFKRYATFGPKWQSFLNRRRDGDEVWRFASANGLHNGFAIVRCGLPVSGFRVLGFISAGVLP